MTQLQAARKGRITEEMRAVAQDEGREPEWIRAEIAAGRIVIPKNRHRDFHPRAVGSGLSTKVNANIGTSQEHCNLEEELRKLEVAVAAGADSVMDLSTGGILEKIRTEILQRSPVMVGVVPVYAAVTRLIQDGKDDVDLTADLLFEEIEAQAKAGVDFMTVHAGVTRASVAALETDPRILGVVSRGGSLTRRWIGCHGRENPLYAQYDRLLDICEAHDVTLSLGDGLRPGAQADATDRGQLAELLVLGELVDRARERGVQVMVEGPGHVPLGDVILNVQLEKRICKNAPFYVLGPLPTDVAPGYDHLVGAIGGALAAAHGADFLCYVTPAEHLCLPDEADVREGVIASKIAAHIADAAKGVPGAAERDRRISQARRDFDWEAIYRDAIDPELARRRKESSESKGEDHCTMCGSLCAVKTDRKVAG
ncbi:MAG: phosphomethylpyrimidine synthase ThiC [Desulfococcaceae bacterium]